MVSKNSNSSKKKEAELDHYIKLMISKGFSERAIIKGLKKKGWSTGTIKSVIKLAKLSKKKEKQKVNLDKKEVKAESKEEKIEKNNKTEHVGSGSKKMQWFFFSIFFISLGLLTYTLIKKMWIAMASVLLLLIISFIAYRVRSSRIPSKDSGGEQQESNLARKKYREALEGEKLRKSNLRDIMKKKHEEEKYIKKIERIKRREERLKRKQEIKPQSKGGKENKKLKKIEKETDRLKEIEVKLEGELDRISEKKEILEKGKKLGATDKDETDLDQLYNYIQKYGKIKLHEVTSMFDVSKKVATEWMVILEEYKLADVYYPALGSPELRKCKK